MEPTGRDVGPFRSVTTVRVHGGFEICTGRDERERAVTILTMGPSAATDEQLRGALAEVYEWARAHPEPTDGEFAGADLTADQPWVASVDVPGAVGVRRLLDRLTRVVQPPTPGHHTGHLPKITDEMLAAAPPPRERVPGQAAPAAAPAKPAGPVNPPAPAAPPAPRRTEQTGPIPMTHQTGPIPRAQPPRPTHQTGPLPRPQTHQTGPLPRPFQTGQFPRVQPPPPPVRPYQGPVYSAAPRPIAPASAMPAQRRPGNRTATVVLIVLIVAVAVVVGCSLTGYLLFLR